LFSKDDGEKEESEQLLKLVACSPTRHGPVRAGPEEEHRNGQRDGALLL